VTINAWGDHQPVGGGDLAKVTFLLDKADWHDHARETLWAEPIGGDRFRLDNIPFYAHGVSYGDTVVAPDSDEGRLVRGVSERGGHSTYRIFVSNTEALQRFPEHWTRLKALGCTLERATERLFAVDLPPKADIYQVYEELTKGEAAGVWDFEEAHVGHLLKAQEH
jgi:hypothetical protein